MLIAALIVTVGAAPTSRIVGKSPAFHSGPAFVLLADGRVLENGGATWDAIFGVTWLLDPRTGETRDSGALVVPRHKHRATLLKDGRVLVTGGTSARMSVSDAPALADVEIFDPKTETYARAASMTSARREHDAVLLDDGRVLVVGGRENGNQVRDAELFDPASGRWRAIPWTKRWEPAVAKLPDGRVLTAGGNVYGVGSLDTVEIFDPKTSTFVAGARLPEKRWSDRAATLADGRVFIAGGATDLDWARRSFIYDPTKNVWLSAAASPESARDPGLALMADGRVLLATTTTCFAYDPKNDTWKKLFDLPKRPQPGRGVLRREGGVLLLAPGSDALLLE